MEEANAAKKVGVIGITLNLLLLVIKFTIGILFRSQGILADAVNSFGDVFSSIVTYVGGKISSRPRDEDHEFGHGKAEFVASFLIGIFMTIVSIDMLYKSILAMIINNKFEISYLVVLVPLITIVIKFIMYIVVTNIGKKNN
jgi:cation diffusion facilitator family transporter